MTNPRTTPTQRHLSQLALLPTDDVIRRALDALHALNRRAKEKRDRSRRFQRQRFADHVREEIDQTYHLKDRLLEHMVLAGRATVETFEVERTSTETRCPSCGRTWFGGGSCNDCGCAGRRDAYRERWFVVDCGNGFRFHQPGEQMSPEVAAMAVEVESHEPRQPQREIPKVGLTIAAQIGCIEMAIERLAAESTHGVPREIVARLDELSATLQLECDGMTRVVDFLLREAAIPRSVKVGLLHLDDSAVAPEHFWIEVGREYVIDYRARMWAGDLPPCPIA